MLKDAWVSLSLIVLGLLAYHFEGGTMEGNLFSLILVIGGVLEVVRGTALKSVESLLVSSLPSIASTLGIPLQNNTSRNNSNNSQQNSGTGVAVKPLL